MKPDKRWLTTELTEDELAMYYNIASLNSQYQYFDLDALQAINLKTFSRNFEAIKSLLNEEGMAVYETLKTKILEFQGDSLS